MLHPEMEHGDKREELERKVGKSEGGLWVSYWVFCLFCFNKVF